MRRLVLLLIVVLLLSASLVWAEEEEQTGDEQSEEEEASDEIPVFTAGEVIVTGRRSPAEQTASMQEITADDIRALGATNAAEALQIFAGARVDAAPTSLSANGKQEKLLSLRGFDPRNVIILIDGVPMYEPYFRVLDLRQIPVGDIAKIKVIKGPTSVLYGPNVLGGVVNIITKRGAGEPTGHVDATYGDVNALAGNASVLGGYRGWDYFVSSGYESNDGYLISDEFDEARNEDGSVRDNSDYRDFVMSGRVGYHQGLNGLSLSASQYQFDGGVPFDMEAIEPGTLWRKLWRKTAVALNGEAAPADFLYVRGRLFYTRFFNTITTYTDATMSQIAAEGDAVSTYDNDVMGYVLLPEFLLGSFGTITLSNIYKYDTVSIQDEIGGEWFDFGAETYSVGAEYGLHAYRFDFTLGGAYHVYRRTETPEDNLGEDNGAFDYQAGLAYSPVDMLSLHVGGAHKSSFPDLKTLYGSNGNPDLKPEYAYNFDAGFRLHPMPLLGLESTWFYSDITDLIGKRELGNEFTYENIDEAAITGVESLLEFDFFEGLFSLSGNYTYMQTQDKRKSRVVESLDFRPENTFAIDGRLRLPFGTSLSTQFYYVGERRYELPGAVAEERTMPEYGIANARLGQTLSWDAGRTSCEVFVQAKNLFDIYYEEGPGKASPGRMLSGGLSFDF